MTRPADRPADDPAMHTLANLRVGVDFQFCPDTGRMCCVRRDGAAFLVGDELDELVVLGWVAVEGGAEARSVTVTGGGCYALSRWLARHNLSLDCGGVR